MSKQTETVLKRVVGESARIEARKLAGKGIAKVIAKRGSKMAARSVARTAGSPWLLAADGAELVVDKAARAAGADERTARRYGKGAGLATSIGVGAAVGGPVGAAAGAGLWAVGELVEWMVD